MRHDRYPDSRQDAHKGKRFMKSMIFFLILFSLSCSDKREDIGVPSLFKVESAAAVSEIAAPSVSSYGSVLYLTKADVYPTSSGIVREIFAEEGDYVEKDFVLALLDDKKLLVQLRRAEADVGSKKALLRLAEEKLRDARVEAEKSILVAEASEMAVMRKKSEYENMKRIYGNKKKLHEAGGLSDEELNGAKLDMERADYDFRDAEIGMQIARTGFRTSDIEAAGYPVPAEKKMIDSLLTEINSSTLKAERDAAEADLRSAVAEAENIKIFLEETKIRSPVSGIVGKRYLDRGEKATSETNMFTIFDTEKVYISADINAEKFSGIAAGTAAEIKIKNHVKKGIVKIVAPFADPKTGGRNIKILTDNSDGFFIPGLLAEVSVLTGERIKRTWIPKDALVSKDDEDGVSVFILRRGRAFMQKIKVDFISGEKVFVSEGIEEGERVAVSGLGHLSDGCAAEERK